ncbi:MAG: hypothetical protein DME69_11350 [Verrucomicrobia bacterium]|nr:MAG: hypothetical protein DME69_11350 [Verrucomicrobiota bacterium]
MKIKTNIIYSAFALFAFTCFALAPQARATCQDACLTNDNTVQGDDALISLTSGTDNTANGSNALLNNTIGIENTATGSHALYYNTTGNYNVANGDYALYSNTTGIDNDAFGSGTMLSNTTGSKNSAIGDVALYRNTTGYGNAASGANALQENTIGSNNTANGAFALFNNTTSSDNTANGFQALFSNTTGRNNTANGYNALYNNTTGGSNITLGFQAGLNLTTGNSNIDIGNVGVAGESKRIRIGTAGTQTKTFIAGISGATVAGGVGVIVGSNGQLGTVVSSERFKDAIKPMDKASEAILALKPVTFHYKKDLDPEGVPQFGLVAEDVEKVNRALVARDADGNVYTVRYDAVNAMLLNEFLKAHRKVEEQEATITQLKSTVAQQQKGMEIFAATLKEQASQIQKVSAQLELNKPAPRTVLNDQ